MVSEAVLIQLIATFGVILAAMLALFGVILTVIANRTRQHAKAASDNSAQTRDQVSNDHTENLRDDLDAKFARMDRKLSTVIRTQASHGRQINKLFANDRQLEEAIEHTQQPQPRSYKPKETNK